jgi:hypothetical protein
LETLPPATRNAFLANLGAAQTAGRYAVVPKRVRMSDGHWTLWTAFLKSLQLGNPYLIDYADLVPLLQVFAECLRTGELAPSGFTLRSHSVEDYVRSVGQEIASLGTLDPRLLANGKLELRLKNQLKGYSRQVPPPDRVKPIPMPLVAAAVQVAYTTPDPLLRATGDCGVICLFFLLRPGEHVKAAPDSDTSLFRLCDVEFLLGHSCYNAATCEDLELILSPDQVHLTFIKQKNGECGEKLAHGSTDQVLMSPIHAILRRVRHLREHNAPPTTPLHTVFLPAGTTTQVTSNRLNAMFRRICRLMPELGLQPSDISARALRAGGAMALLCTLVDPLLVQLVGRWKSDVTLRYLHLQATNMHDLVTRMLSGGDFKLLPNQTLPSKAVALLSSCPAAESA